MRRTRREAHSMDDYRRTLDVLGHVRAGGGAPGSSEPGPQQAPQAGPQQAPQPGPQPAEEPFQEVAPPAGFEPPGGETEVTPRRSARGRVRIGSGTVPLVFDDSSSPTLGTSVPPPTSGARPQRDRSLAVMQRPAHRLGGVLGVVVLCLVIAAALVAYAVVRSRHHGDLAGGQHTSATHGSTSSHRPSTSRSGSAPRRAGSTSTGAPASYTAVHATTTDATYEPRRSDYSITLGALGAPCWVSVTSTSGTVVFEQTFAPGATATVKLSGTSTLDIGAPKAVSLEIDGVPAVIPATAAGPFSVTLSPVGTGT